jgi:putative nucleotidyltransferase with HDIG domain
MTRRSRPSLNLELKPSRVPGDVAFHAARWGLLLALAVLTYLLFPVAGGFEGQVPDPGDVAQEEVIAPFAFDVEKSPAEQEREAAQLEGTVRPIYEYRGGVLDTVLAAIDSLFATLSGVAVPDSLVTIAQGAGVALTVEEAAYLMEGGRLNRFRGALRNMYRRYLPRGVADFGTLEEERTTEVVLRRGEREAVVRRDTLLTRELFFASREAFQPDPQAPLSNPVFVKLINGLFQPTLVPNTAEYEQHRRELRESLDPVKYRVQASERIIDANEVVTQEVHERLAALRAEQFKRGGEDRSVGASIGQVLANGLVIGVFWLLIMLYRPRTYATFRHMLVLALLFGVVVVGAALTVRFIVDAPELIPIPFAAMLITVLFRGRVAMVAAMVLAVLVASQSVYADVDTLLVAMVGGVAAAVSVRSIRRRNQFLIAVVVVASAYLLTGITVGLRADWSLTEVGLTGLRGGLTAFASAALAFTLLPVVESVTRITTDLTLLELSDPDRSLLRRLATEAPGTYAHSIAMANLCEAACNAIGANGLLARVGCYYHDVGKLKKPQHFVENQTPGTNPHDKLKPEVSAGIIRNHVRDGIALAEESKLPEVVKAFIPEHHGTMEITYFLERARSREPEAGVDLEDYRYPGPRPQSVETAAAMLADGVEAAIRVLEDPSPEKLGNAIDHIIRHRIEAGQLEEAPLTLVQLNRLREEFVRVLGGAHHNRIDYPAASGGIGADWEAAASGA